MQKASFVREIFGKSSDWGLEDQLLDEKRRTRMVLTFPAVCVRLPDQAGGGSFRMLTNGEVVRDTIPLMDQLAGILPRDRIGILGQVRNTGNVTVQRQKSLEINEHRLAQVLN